MCAFVCESALRLTQVVCQHQVSFWLYIQFRFCLNECTFVCLCGFFFCRCKIGVCPHSAHRSFSLLAPSSMNESSFFSLFDNKNGIGKEWNSAGFLVGMNWPIENIHFLFKWNQIVFLFISFLLFCGLRVVLAHSNMVIWLAEDTLFIWEWE